MRNLIIALVLFLSSCQVSRVYDLNNYKATDFDTTTSEWKEFKMNLVVYIPGNNNWNSDKIYGYQQMLVARCTKSKHKKLKKLLKAFWIDSKKTH
jgi:hypothetical protein